MAIDAASIRNIINLKDGSSEGDPVELSNEAIESAISRSETFVSHLATRSGSSVAVVELAKLNYAAYLAYQSYADRIVEELPGAFNQQGVFQPIANPVAKQVMEKLRSLKQTSDELIELLQNTPLAGDSGETPGPTDAEEYPAEMKLSNLSSKW